MSFTLYERKTRPALHRCIELPVIVKTVGHYIVPMKHYDGGRINSDTNRIFWVVNGEGIVRHGNRIQAIQANSVVYYQAYSDFYIEARNGPLEYYWCSMLGKLVNPIAQSFGIKENGNYACTELPIALLKNILGKLDHTDALSLRESSHHSYQLLSFIKNNNDNNNKNEICNKALKLIDTHWQDANFSINSCAKRLNIHRSSLNRHFQEHIGNSPGQYLIRYRLQEAIQRLKESDATVADIAHAVGYSDAQYFSRHFKKEIKCTPSEFRAQNVNVPWD